MYICIYTHILMYIHIHMHIYIYTYMYIHTKIHINIYLHTYIHLCTSLPISRNSQSVSKSEPTFDWRGREVGREEVRVEGRETESARGGIVSMRERV